MEQSQAACRRAGAGMHGLPRCYGGDEASLMNSGLGVQTYRVRRRMDSSLVRIPGWEVCCQLGCELAACMVL